MTIINRATTLPQLAVNAAISTNLLLNPNNLRGVSGYLGRVATRVEQLPGSIHNPNYFKPAEGLLGQLGVKHPVNIRLA
jgi:hypothetical protein